MKRSLIILLVVALLAMMVPTIAAADGKLTKLELNTYETQAYLSRDDQGAVLEGYQDVRIYSRVEGSSTECLVIDWTTSDRNIAGFADKPDHNIITQQLSASGDDRVPKLDGRAVGDVFIKGTCYWAEDVRRLHPLSTIGFTLHVRLVPEKEIKIDIKKIPGYDTHYNAKEKYFEYWMVKEAALPGDITALTDIGNNGFIDLEALATVLPDGSKANEWASTYGVSDLFWTSSDTKVATVDRWGIVEFVGTGTVTITATAKGDPTVKASVTFVIVPPAAEEDPSYEAFKSIKFTQDKFVAHRGWNFDLNLAQYLELDPRPVEKYQGSTEHPDTDADGNYGVKDDIVWTSSNENIAWIFDPQNADYQYCTVVFSDLAEEGDKVTIRAASKLNPALYAEVELTLMADNKVELKFERGSYTMRTGEEEILWLMPDNLIPNVDWTHVTVTSSDPEIVSVGADPVIFSYLGSFAGVAVTAGEPGQATITLTGRNLKAPVTTVVNVVGGEVKSVTVPTKYQKITMPLYDVDSRPEVFDGMNTTEVHVNISPVDAWYKATWTSSDPKVAYIVYDGDVNNDTRFATIRAAGVGTCTITVTVNDGKNTFTASMEVEVVKASKVTKLSLNKTKARYYLRRGGANSTQLIAKDAKTGNAVPVKWTTSDKTIATVNANGLVKFKKAGVVKITATTTDGSKLSKTCTITLKKQAVTLVKADFKALTLNVGGSTYLSVKALPENAYDTRLSYKSSNSKIVAVDSNGLVHALKPGKATVTITAKDGSKKSAKVVITVTGSAENAEDLILNIDGLEDIEALGDIADEVIEFDAE